MQKKYGNKNAHLYGVISPKRRMGIQERRRKILVMIQNDPGIRQLDIAKKLKVDRSTIGNDLKAMSEEIKLHNTESWQIQRDRILAEIHQKKAVCEDRMQRLASHPHQGSRWMEEWQKLLDKEAKILSIYSPDRLLIQEKEQFSKEQEDAAIDAMMKTMGTPDDSIELIAGKDKTYKKIE
jgi:hypothetical protein